MSETFTPPAAEPSPEAVFLRQSWSPEILGRYEGQWIAVVGNEIISSGADFETIAAETVARRPLYAFVTFEGLQ